MLDKETREELKSILKLDGLSQKEFAQYSGHPYISIQRFFNEYDDVRGLGAELEKQLTDKLFEFIEHKRKEKREFNKRTLKRISRTIEMAYA